jgi:hypothetical protein
MPHPAICAYGRQPADCRKEANDRQDCFLKAQERDPRLIPYDLVGQLSVEAARVEALITAEVACRASVKCLDQRLAQPVCYNIQRKRELLESIRQEKANPAGVVDLVTLHNLGEGVQNADADIATTRANFQTGRHKPFSEALCR